MILRPKKIKKLEIILTILLFIIFTISISSCKEEMIEEEQQQEEIKNDEIVIDSSETKEETKLAEEETTNNPVLEAILQEKVPFISEALPGAKLNTKTGELTAKAGNEWGNKEGESIGWYVVKAFKMETADGVEEEQDAVGLIPKVIEALQNKILEEKDEKHIPILINLKETEDVKITELKINSGELSGVSSLGINLPVGSIIYTPVSGEYGFAPLTLSTKTKTKDKSLGYGYYYKEEDNSEWSGQFSIGFVDGNIIPKPKETQKISVEGREAEVSSYEIKLGDSLIEITGPAFLDETANKINDVWFFYENPGSYQLNLLHFKNFFKDGEIVSYKTMDFLGLKTNQGTESIPVFILLSEPVYEQAK